MSEGITITLPCPPPEARPNGRSHWRVKAKAVANMRKDATCYAIATAAPMGLHFPQWTHASIRIDWYHVTKRLLDRDNIIASCKAYIDGVVDAGVLADDRDVTFLPVGRFVDKDNPRVEICVTPTQDAA